MLPSLFLNDVPNLLAHFKLLISFIFKSLLRAITVSTGWNLIASAGPQERSRCRNAIKYWSSTKYLPWHLLGAATVIGTGTAGVVTEDAQLRVSHGNWLAESNKSIREDESGTQEVRRAAARFCWKVCPISFLRHLFCNWNFCKHFYILYIKCV